MNLFAGVVVSTFNKEKEILEKNHMLNDRQQRWIEQKKVLLKLEPKLHFESEGPGLRAKIVKVVLSKRFEIFILVCISLNTVTLAICYYSQPVYVDDVFDFINYGFASLFAIEASVKVFALGPKVYFSDKGNQFDFCIVLCSIFSTILSLVMNIDFGASSTFIRALRISRVFSFVSLARQIKILFETLIVTIPSLTNIGGLLLLFLYIYSVLGVFLFADV